MANNIDKFVTTTEHGAIDHTVGPLNLLNTAAHALVNHAGIPGAGGGVDAQNNGGAAQGPRARLNFIPSGAAGIAVVDNPGQSRVDITVSATAEAFTSGVHATTNHAGITGVGLTTKQSLILPAGVPFQYWTPDLSNSLLALTFIPKSTDPALIGLTVDAAGASSPTATNANIAGLGPVKRYTFPFLGTKLRMHDSTGYLTNVLLPRLVIKLKVSSSASLIFQFGLASSSSTATFFSQVDAIFVEETSSAAWTIERRVSGATKTSTPTGIAAATAVYVLFNYTSTTSVTVTFYDTTTLAVLFTTTFTGASEVPAAFDRVRLYADGGGGAIVDLASILLSFNDA